MEKKDLIYLGIGAAIIIVASITLKILLLNHQPQLAHNYREMESLCYAIPSASGC